MLREIALASGGPANKLDLGQGNLIFRLFVSVYICITGAADGN